MPSQTRTVLMERYFFLLALPVFLISASSYAVANVYIVLGQAHFLLTYLEQWKKGIYTQRSFLLFAVAFLAALALLSVDRDCFIFFVAAFFLVHSSFDDLRLMKTLPDREAAFIAAPHLSLALAASGDALLHTGLSRFVFPAAAAGYAATLLYALAGARWRNPYILYCLCLTPVIFLIYHCSMQSAAPVETAAVKIFGLIILSHYFNWYAHIYHKLAAVSPQDIQPYVGRVIAANMITIGGWFLSSRGLQGIGHDFIYRSIYYPPAFYFWTLMHLLVTARKSDYSIKQRAAV